MGDVDAAVAHLERAVTAEDALGYNEPEYWPVPPRHVLGAVLLDAGRAAAAQKVYEAALEQHRENGWSLLGLHAVHEDDDGTDLMIEVKDWEREPGPDAVRRFIEASQVLGGQLERKTVFLFYSESGLGEDAAALLAEAGILVLDPDKLAGFEGFPR